MKLKKVYLEISNVCNLNCFFCIKTSKEKRYMSTEEINICLKEIKKVSDYVYLHVKGEPLIHPDLEEILQLINENKLFVNITTNGTLIKDKINTLLNYPIRQINISMHSIYNYSKEKKDEYLNSVVDLIKQNKNSFISLRLWINNQELNNYIVSFLEDKLGKIRKDKFGDRCYISFDEEFKWPEIEDDINNNQYKCYGGVAHLGILADGTIVLCCLDASGVTNLGNIFKGDSLKDILESNKIREIVNSNVAKEELCKHCYYRNRFIR